MLCIAMSPNSNKIYNYLFTKCIHLWQRYYYYYYYYAAFNASYVGHKIRVRFL